MDELVCLSRNGNTSAFDELARRNQALVFRTALRVLKNVEDAEDAVQDAYINAFTRLDSFRGDSLFSTWLVRVTLNVALMKLRNKRARPALSLADLQGDEYVSYSELFRSFAPTPEEICSDRESLRHLYTAMERLPEKLREITMLRLKHELTMQELGELKGISTAAVKSRLLRARNALIQDLAAKNAVNQHAHGHVE